MKLLIKILIIALLLVPSTGDAYTLFVNGVASGGGSGSGDMAKTTYDTNDDSMVDADKVNAGIDAAKIGGGGVSTTEFDYLGAVTSDVQAQLNAKAPSANIALTALANQAAQTVNANATDGAAAPTAVAISASQVVARLAAGNIKGASTAEMKTLLGYPTSGEYQASDATLTALAGATLADVSVIEGTGADAVAVVTSGGANRLLGSNSDNTALEFKDTINAQFSDDAAQFKSATASKGTMKVLLTGSTDGKLLTVAYNHTDNKTLNMPDPTTGDSVAYGSAAIRFNTGGATARVVTLPDAAVTIPANPIGGTLGATANVIPKANGTGTSTLQASGMTEDGTKVDIGALNLVTTGQSSGRVVVVTDADGKTLSGTDLYGSMQMSTGAGTWTIPDVDSAAGTGQCFCVYATAAHEIVIAGDAEDKIRLAGTLGAAGGDITNNTAEAAGDFICLMLTDFAADVAHWTTLGYKGTWTVVP